MIFLLLVLTGGTRLGLHRHGVGSSLPLHFHHHLCVWHLRHPALCPIPVRRARAHDYRRPQQHVSILTTTIQNTTQLRISVYNVPRNTRIYRTSTLAGNLRNKTKSLLLHVSFKCVCDNQNQSTQGACRCQVCL